MIDWDELVRREGPVVWRSVYRLVNNQADADDCFQETFVAALQVSRRQAVAHWPSLLKRLAVARAVDRVRQRLRRTRRSDATDVATVVASAPDPRAQAETAELAATLRWALAQIPARSAEAFCLHELEGWSYREIGEHLALGSGAVGVLLHRTRKRLQKLLSKTHARHA